MRRLSESVAPLLKAETDKVFLFTLNSKSKPSIFSAATPGYTDTGKKETYSAEDGSAYFRELADAAAKIRGLAARYCGLAS